MFPPSSWGARGVSLLRSWAEAGAGAWRFCCLGYSRPTSITIILFIPKHGEKMSREELQSILDDIDPEGTGKLDYAEVL